MNESMQEALEALDLTWVIDREGLRYKTTYGRSGKQLNIRSCPCCGNDKYKVYVNADNGLGSCFAAGCDLSTFNKFKFLKYLFNAEGRALRQIIESLAREQGWRPRKKREEGKPEKPDYSLLELPPSVPVSAMPDPPLYLTRRGVTRSLADYFGLRWCEKGVYTAPPMGTRRSAVQDYSQRVIIPVWDLDGTLVTFQGRDATGEAEQRYLFPPTFAASGAFLYNGHQIQPHHKTLVICEGAFDVIGAKRALDTDPGLQYMHPVGTFGMHLSNLDPNGDDQMGRLLQLKARGVSEVIFLWDAEPAAVKEATDAALGLLKRGFKVKVALLPAGQDPGDASSGQIVRSIREARPIRSGLDAARINLSFRSGQLSPAA